MKEYESFESLIRLDRKLEKEAEHAPDYPPERLVSEYLEVADKIRGLQTFIQELQDRRERFRAKVFVKGRRESTLTDQKVLYVEKHCNKRFQYILQNRGSSSLSDSEAERNWANFVHKTFDHWNTTPASGQTLRNIEKLTKKIILNDTALHGWREHLRLLEVIAEEKTVTLPPTVAVTPPPSPDTSVLAENQSIKTEQADSIGPEKSSPSRRETRRFNPRNHGGKEVCIIVSYAKAGNRNPKKLAMGLTHKASIRYPGRRYSQKTPLAWCENDRKGFNKHTHRMRKKAKDNGWWENIPKDYHLKYTG